MSKLNPPVIVPTRTPWHHRLLCGLGFHSWGGWSTPFSYPAMLLHIVYQRRICTRCGKVKEREV